jgi:hypothetical protein
MFCVIMCPRRSIPPRANACGVGVGEDTHLNEQDTMEIPVNETLNLNAAQKLPVVARLVKAMSNAHVHGP